MHFSWVAGGFKRSYRHFYILQFAREDELVLLNSDAAEDSWESLGLHDRTSQSSRKSTLNIHWKDWCWNSNTLATWCEQPTHWKRPWCWERLKAKGEGGSRRWDGQIPQPTQRTWTGANSGRYWSTEEPGVLQFLGLQRETWFSNCTTTTMTREQDYNEDMIKSWDVLWKKCFTI